MKFDLYLLLATMGAINIALFYAAWHSARKQNDTEQMVSRNFAANKFAKFSIIIFIFNIIVCAIIANPDYSISIFLLFMVFFGTIVALRNISPAIFKFNYIYKPSKRKSKKVSRDVISIIFKLINLIIIAPIIGLCAGGIYHSYADGSAVDLLVFMAFMASVFYAIALTYFAATSKSVTSFAFSLILILICAGLISISPRLDMA